MSVVLIVRRANGSVERFETDVELGVDDHLTVALAGEEGATFPNVIPSSGPDTGGPP